MGCCTKCEGAPEGPPRGYQLQYNVTYLPATAATPPPVEATLLAVDVYGGIEFNVAAEGPGRNFSFSRVMAADHFCPQAADFALVRCWAHEHPGGLEMRVTDAATGAPVCASRAIREPGAAPYFRQRFTVQDHAPPLRLRPGQLLRFEFEYDASVPYSAAMSIWQPVYSGFNMSGCPTPIDFRGIIQPPPQSAAPAPPGAPAAEADLLGAALAEGAALVDAVSAVPADCSGASAFVAEKLTPCLPLLLANLTAAPPPPADAAACCAVGAADIVADMIAAVEAARGRAECVCPLGAAARALSQSPRLVLALRAVDETCSPGNPPEIFSTWSVGGILNIGVTGVFAPLCPELAEVSGNGVGVSAMDGASAMG